MSARVVSLKIREFLVDDMAALFGTCVTTGCFEVLSLVFWIDGQTNCILTTVNTTDFPIDDIFPKYTQLLTRDTSTAFGGIGKPNNLAAIIDGIVYPGLRIRYAGILVAWRRLCIRQRLRNFKISGVF